MIPTVVDGLILLVGVLIGLVIGMLVAAGRSRAVRSELRQAESAKAGLESSQSELRTQVASLKVDLDNNRSKLELEQNNRASAEASLTHAQKSIVEQKQLLDEAEEKLTHVFESLASKTLSKSTEQFLELAKSKLEVLQGNATSELEQRRVAIEGIVGPLQTSLSGLQAELTRVESSRQEAYGSLKTEVLHLTETSKELRQETGSLVTSLRQPQIKGKWGEMTLRRAVELAGLSPHCDFVEQSSVQTEDGRLRPDMIVRLAGGADIVVDAKVPLEAFLQAVSAKDEPERKAAMIEHVRLVRAHVSQLSSRSYWNQFTQTPDFVVLFMPAESFFSAALEQDRTLIEDALGKRVILASPTTLIALLRSVAQGWRQEQIAENAERISTLGKDVCEKITKFMEYMADIRAGLERANKAYNNAVGSLESRLLPSARKFRELGVHPGSELQPSEPIETALRPLTTTGTMRQDPPNQD